MTANPSAEVDELRSASHAAPTPRPTRASSARSPSRAPRPTDNAPIQPRARQRPLHAGRAAPPPAPDEHARCRPTASSTARSPGCSSTSGCSSSPPTRPCRCSSGPASSRSSPRNLDEFFMVRVAGLKRRIATGIAVRSASGLEPREVLEQISLVAHELHGDARPRLRASRCARRSSRRGHHDRPLGRADRGRARAAQRRCSPTGCSRC